MNFGELVTTKTFWTAVAGVITTVGAVVTGEMGWTSAIAPTVMSLLGVFIRDGMISGQKTLAEPAKPGQGA